jgi:hypothetical protein
VLIFQAKLISGVLLNSQTFFFGPVTTTMRDCTPDNTTSALLKLTGVTPLIPAKTIYQLTNSVESAEVVRHIFFIIL